MWRLTSPHELKSAGWMPRRADDMVPSQVQEKTDVPAQKQPSRFVLFRPVMRSVPPERAVCCAWSADSDVNVPRDTLSQTHPPCNFRLDIWVPVAQPR